MRFYRKDAIKTSSNNQVYETADDTKVDDIHCVKSVRIPSYAGPHFPIFRLNTERYGVSLRIWSECGKMRARMIPNTDTFHAVILI